MDKVIQIALNAVDNSRAAFASLEENLNGVEGQLKSVRSHLEDNKEAFKGLATAGGVALGAISAAVYTSVKAFGEAERSQRQLSHAVVDVSKGTYAEVDAIIAVTTALQQKVGIDGDALTMGAAQLSTFGLQTKSVQALTKTLADLTVNQNGVNATSDNYISSANIMAKALKGQFGLLEKMGIRFTDVQQKILQTGTETQKVAALQQGLAQNLRETTDTLGGVDTMFARLTTSMGEVSETLGSIFAPMIESVLDKVGPIIVKFQEWVTNNADLVAKLVIAAAAVAAFTLVLGTLGLAALSVTSGLLALASPFVLIGVAIAAAIAGFIIFKDSIMQWAETTGVLNALQVAWGYIKLAFEALAAVWSQSLKPALMELWNALTPLQPLLTFIGQVIGVTLLAAIVAASFAFAGIAAAISLVLQVLSPLITFITTVVMSVFSNLKATITQLYTIWTGGMTGVGTVWEKVWASIEAIIKGRVNTIIDVVNGMINFILAGVNAVVRAINSVTRLGAKVGLSIPQIPEVSAGALNIPKFADGGIVTRPLVGMIGEAGPEAIIPLSKAGNIGGGTVLNITVNGDISGRELIEKVQRAIMSDLKHNVRIA